MFHTARDVALYKEVRYAPGSFPGPVRLRLREGGPVTLLGRAGTTDAKVLWHTFSHGYHQPPWWVRPKGWIVDLGANVGYTTAHLACRYPEAQVLAVEVDAANAAACAINLAPLGSRCHG